MQTIIDGKKYDTEKATLLASDRYFDGSNWERSGRNTYLYKSPRGAFFVHHTTCWHGERDTLELVDIDQAKELYESLLEREVDYKAAFGIEPEEG